jgi:glycosyltransferase involved in cell wall biosynthesis
VLLHDFHMVCPSHFLLDKQGIFCGVPDVSKCRQCLPHIDDGLVRLFQARDIDVWRQRWGDMLKVADEVIHFSKSTRELFAIAYPEIREEQWVFRPHSMPPPQGQFSYPQRGTGLRVGVIGQIGLHKGSEVIVELMAEAAKQKVDLHIVIVGTMHGQINGPSITQTGRYHPDNLAGLLNEHQVHLALMPSIWAETFSYVTHELIDLQVPVLAFDFGAQAEAVSAYSRGRVIPFGGADELLRQIQSFKSELDGCLLY